jgi:hypothetical protein
MRLGVVSFGLLLAVTQARLSAQTSSLTQFLRVGSEVTLVYPEGWAILKAKETPEVGTFAVIYFGKNPDQPDAHIAISRMNQTLSLPLSTQQRADVLSTFALYAKEMGGIAENLVVNEIAVNQKRCLFARMNINFGPIQSSQVSYLFPGNAECFKVTLFGEASSFSRHEKLFHEMMKKFEYPQQEVAESMVSVNRIIQIAAPVLLFLILGIWILSRNKKPQSRRFEEYERQFPNLIR